jgi:hypothetical protein
MTEPNDEAMKILKNRDDMTIKHEMTSAAGHIASHNRNKTYADAIWEEAAKGNITDVEAIKRIEEYERKNKNEQFEMLLKLRDEGIVNDTDVSQQKQFFLSNATTGTKMLETKDTSSIDEFFEEDT